MRPIRLVSWFGTCRPSLRRELLPETSGSLMIIDWLRELRADLAANSPLTRGRMRRVRHGAKRSGFQAVEALESRVMLAGALGEVTSFSKISDTEGGFTAFLNFNSSFGSGIAELGDLDGDGINDLAVGSEDDGDGGPNRGAFYVLFMNADGTVKSHQKVSDTAGGFTASLENADVFGTSLTNLGDLDGDGVVDLAVSAIGDDDGGTLHGAVYIVFLKSDGTAKSHQKISDTAGNFTGVLDDSDRFGIALENLGDIDGDGVTDLGVGARDRDGGYGRGAVYVLFMKTDGTVKSHQKISDLAGNFTATLENTDLFGTSLTNLGDLDGDGTNDLAVGASGDDDGGGDGEQGAVYLLFLNNDGTVKSHQKISQTVGNLPNLLRDEGFFGSSLSNMGDLNGDGIVDLAVGAYLDDDGGDRHGAVYILFLNADGTVQSSQKISDTEGNFPATLDDNDRFGRSLTNLGDLDGDGLTELAVGTPRDDDGGTNRGAVYILSLEQVTPPGVVTASRKISDTAGNFTAGLDVGDRFGSSATVLGDLDGDGIVDMAVGAYNDDIDGGILRGAVYVLFLNADGTVKSHQKISDTEGNFTANLSNIDQFGRSLTNVGDLDGDGVTDLAVGAHRDNDGGADRGAVYVLFLNADGTVKSHQKISDTAGNFTATLSSDDYFGMSLTNLGDLDGDGLSDIAVGAYRDDDGGGDRGAVYVLFLNTDGTVKSHQKISDTAGNFTAILDDGDLFGSSLTILGDLDGDGVTDLAVGAHLDDDGGTDRGAVHVLFLNTDGTVKSHQTISDTAGNFTASLDDIDRFGWSLTHLGDLDGDYVTDLAVGAMYDDDGGGFDRGAVYVLFLNADGTVKSHQKISDTAGNFTAFLSNGDFFGMSLTNLGDLDGDGLTDIAVGALGDDDGGGDQGAVYILSLEQVTPPGVVSSTRKISDTAGNFTGILDDADTFGWSVASIGDLDGDGVSDVAVGADGDGDGGDNRGAVYVLFLNADGTVKSHQKISDTAGNFTATLEDDDLFGWSVANLGDLDKDGITDLVVGARGDDDGGSNRGAAYVLFLNADGTVKSYQKISDTQGGFAALLDDGDRFGQSATSLGDLDGDGIVDLVIGARGDSDGGIARGAVYVLFLNADGTVKSHQKINDTQGGFTGTLDDFDIFGWSVAGLGDLDGDGITDLAVGAMTDDDGGGNSDRGAVYVLFLNADGTVKSHQKISDTEGSFTALLDEDDRLGNSVTNLGDLDGDGIADLAVGAYEDDDGGTNHGAVYVLFMNSDGTVKSHQKISDTQGNFTATLDDFDAFGTSLANLGDLDGDGIVELAVGAFEDDDGGTDNFANRGAVYILSLTGVPYVQIVDDGDAKFSTVGTWKMVDNPGARDGDLDHRSAGAGDQIARWEFTGLVPGNYRVSTTWLPFSNRALDAPYIIRDGVGGTALDSVFVNQKLAPDDFTDDGSDWENLTVVEITSGTLVVELSNLASGFVIADAVRIELTTDPAPIVPFIVDDGDAGFATFGAWNLTPVGNGRESDLRNSVKGDGSDKATWTFTGLTPGNYLVSATWFAHANRATNAPFSIFDGTGAPPGAPGGNGAPLLTTRLINQELAPNDFSDRGSNWERLAVVTITGTELVIELTDDANQYVIADAIHVLPTLENPSTIIDDGDPSFSTTTGWTSPPVSFGYNNDQLNTPKGDGSRIATWTFDNLTPGAYRVSATWTSHPNRASDAPFTIFDGVTPLITLDVNQELAPNDFTSFGADWEDLGTFVISGNTLAVQLTNAADQYVIADAIRIEQVGP